MPEKEYLKLDIKYRKCYKARYFSKTDFLEKSIFSIEKLKNSNFKQKFIQSDFFNFNIEKGDLLFEFYEKY